MGEAQACLYAAHTLCDPPKDNLGNETMNKASQEQGAPQNHLMPIRELRRVRKNQASRFSKRRKNLVKKAHELHEDCDIDVFLCVRSKRNNQIWQYSTGFSPPLQAEIVSLLAK